MGDWVTVDTKTKKREKDNRRLERKQQEKEEVEKEEQEKKDAKERFLQQYATAGGSPSWGGVNSYSALWDVPDQKTIDKQNKAKKKPKQIPEDGEHIEFVHIKEEREEKERERERQRQRDKNKKQQLKSTTKGKTVLSMKEASSQITTASIKELITEYSVKYPDNYDVQLKGMAEYFEGVFNAVEQVEEEKERTDVPLAYLDKGAVDAVKIWIDKVPEESVALFFWFLVSTLVTISTDKKATKPSGYGLRALIQIFSRHHPSVIIKNVPQIRDHYFQNGVMPFSLAPLMIWIFSQPMDKNISAVLTLWFHCLYPLLYSDSTPAGIRTKVLSMLAHIMKTRTNTHVDDATATQMYERFMVDHYSSRKVDPVMKSYYPALLEHSFLYPPGSVSRRFFTMLLSYAANEQESIRMEALNGIVSCLARDKSTTKFWLEIYPKYIPQSNNVMLFLYRSWEKETLAKKLDASALLVLAKGFINTNKLIAQDKYVDKKGKKPKGITKSELDVCNSTCKSILKKLKGFAPKEQKSGMGPTLPLISLVLLIGAGTYYTVSNCCLMDWCRSIDVMQELLHCANP